MYLWHKAWGTPNVNERGLFFDVQHDIGQWGFGLFLSRRVGSALKKGWTLHLVLPVLWVSLEYIHWLPMASASEYWELRQALADKEAQAE